jgi:hypothetical protein
MYTSFMSKSITKLKIALARIQKERVALHRLILKDQDMAVGSVSVVKGSCGKSTCHCASGKTGHLQTIFLFKGPDARRRCKLVRQEDSDRLLKAHKYYADFRNSLRKLRHLSRREQTVGVAIRKERSLNYK